MELDDEDFIQQYCCSQPPARLWRVQHNQSQATLQENGDLVAALSDIAADNVLAFYWFFKKHLRWGYCKDESPFISCVSSRQEAVDWAKARYTWADRQLPVIAATEVYEIDCRSLQVTTLAFKVDHLLEQFDIRVNRDTQYEYVILSRVPTRYITLVEDIRELLQRERSQGQAQAVAEAEAEVEAAQWQRHAELHGFDLADEYSDKHDDDDDWAGGYNTPRDDEYDTDDKVEENDLDDDLVEMIDDLWN